MIKLTFQNVTKLICFLLMASFILSCKKEPTDTNSTTPHDLLTAHKWRFYTHGSSRDSKNVEWMPASSLIIEDCLKDEYLQFTKEGKMIMSQGTDICFPNQPLSNSYDYSLTTDNSQIHLTNGERMKIIKLSTDTLQYIIITNEPNQQARAWVTY